MSLLFDVFKAWFIGVALSLALPLVAGLLPWQYAKHVIQPYQEMALSLIGSAIMIQRGASIKLKKAVRDVGTGTWRITLNGEDRYFGDPKGNMSTLFGYPFGLASEDRNTILSARDAYFGRKLRELKQDDRLVFKDHYKAYFGVSEGRELVDLNDALPIIQKSGRPEDSDRVKTYGEKSQVEFNSRNLMQSTAFFVALGVGAGIVWIANEFASASGGGSTIVQGITILPSIPL